MAVINESAKDDAWKYYTANVLHSIGAGLYGEGYPMPTFTKLMHLEKEDDGQTGADIIEHIINRLRGEG